MQRYKAKPFKAVEMRPVEMRQSGLWREALYNGLHHSRLGGMDRDEVAIADAQLRAGNWPTEQVEVKDVWRTKSIGIRAWSSMKRRLRALTRR